MKQLRFFFLITICLFVVVIHSCSGQENSTSKNNDVVFDYGVSNHSVIPGYDNSIVGASIRLLEIKDREAVISFFITYLSQKTGVKQIKRITEDDFLVIENNPAVLELLHNEVKVVLPKLQTHAVNIIVLDDTDEVIVLFNSPDVKGGAKLSPDK